MILEAIVMYLVLVAVFYPAAAILCAVDESTQTIQCNCGRAESRDVICGERDINGFRDALTSNCPWCQSNTDKEDGDV